MSDHPRSDVSILVVEHEESCPPGWLGEWLSEAGAQLDVRRPYLGDAIPRDPTSHAGIVVLGGSMDADQDVEFPWLVEVRHLLEVAATTGTPVLGICLGLQLMALAFGGQVHRNPLGQQLGVLPVGWSPAADEDRLFRGLTDLGAVQWNKDVVRALPEEVVVLAETGRAEIQAARFGSSMWGVQWHPEAGEEIIARWADEDRDEVLQRGIDIDEYVAQVAAAEPGLQGWRTLAARFVELSGRHHQASSSGAPLETAWHA